MALIRTNLKGKTAQGGERRTKKVNSVLKNEVAETLSTLS